MGGHGLYVWSSYGLALAVVLFNVVAVSLARRRFLAEAAAQQRRHGAATDRRSPGVES
jgi:heme exporter protein D